MSEPQAAAAAPRIQPRRLVLSTLAGLAGVMLAMALVAYFAHAPLVRVSRGFVDSLGGLGVAIGFFLPDAFTVPLPNDVASALGLAGGMRFWHVVAWAFGGSIAGGTVGYGIGRFLGTRPLVRRFLDGRGATVRVGLEQHGLVFVAIAALTPIPYSLSCWAAGAAKLSFGKFLLVSQLRIFRVAGYLYLIELGLVSASLG